MKNLFRLFVVSFRSIRIFRFIYCYLTAILLVACIAPQPSAPTQTPTVPPSSSNLVPSAENSSKPTLIARLTHFSGDVTVQSVTAQRRIPGLLLILAQQRPTRMQPLSQGSTVIVGQGASATIVCINNQYYKLTAPGTYVITGASCNSGQPLPSASCPLSPSGTVCNIDGSKTIVDADRDKEGDYGRIPVILTPRNSRLLELTPTIEMVSVEGAIDYQLSLSGPTSFDDIELPAEQLSCTAVPHTAPNQLCTIVWPETWSLQPGKRYFLKISARLGIASPWRASETSALRTLDTATVKAIQTDAAAIEALQLDTTTTQLLLAGFYAQKSLYSKAIPLYEQLASEQPAAVLYTTLGDTYRLVELQRYAARAYTQTLQLLDTNGDDVAVRAGAEFGLGQVEYNRMNFKEAEPHFVKAVELYTQIADEVGVQAAQTGLDETRKRLT